jgi:hypothetical protein
MAISDLFGPRPALLGVLGGPGVQSLPGVATVFDVKNTISADLERQVALELDKAPPGTTTAALNVHTRRGVNLVIASRSESGKLTAALWVGKSGWDQPIKEGWEGGVSLRGAWGGK